MKLQDSFRAGGGHTRNPPWRFPGSRFWTAPWEAKTGAQAPLSNSGVPQLAVLGGRFGTKKKVSRPKPSVKPKFPAKMRFCGWIVEKSDGRWWEHNMRL